MHARNFWRFRRRLSRPAPLHLALAGLVWLWVVFYLLIALHGGAGFDSHAYWATRDGIRYVTDPGEQDAYLYSPAFAQAIRPLTLLPWPAFAVLWSLMAVATYAWLARAATGWWRAALFALCLGDIVYGNVWWLFALILVFGFRYAALWAIPLVVKVTPAVGLVWFATRGEWRKLGVAVGAAAVIALLSFWLAPGAWADWTGLLQNGHATFPNTPLLRAIRLAAAVCVTLFAARASRPALLPAALWLASPMLSLNGIGVFAAALSIGGEDKRPR